MTRTLESLIHERGATELMRAARVERDECRGVNTLDRDDRRDLDDDACRRELTEVPHLDGERLHRTADARLHAAQLSVAACRDRGERSDCASRRGRACEKIPAVQTVLTVHGYFSRGTRSMKAVDHSTAFSSWRKRES